MTLEESLNVRKGDILKCVHPSPRNLLRVGQHYVVEDIDEFTDHNGAVVYILFIVREVGSSCAPTRVSEFWQPTYYFEMIYPPLQEEKEWLDLSLQEVALVEIEVDL